MKIFTYLLISLPILSGLAVPNASGVPMGPLPFLYKMAIKDGSILLDVRTHIEPPSPADYQRPSNISPLNQKLTNSLQVEIKKEFERAMTTKVRILEGETGDRPIEVAIITIRQADIPKRPKWYFASESEFVINAKLHFFNINSGENSEDIPLTLIAYLREDGSRFSKVSIREVDGVLTLTKSEKAPALRRALQQDNSCQSAFLENGETPAGSSSRR